MMSTKYLIDQILKNAQMLVQKNELIHKTFKNRDKNRHAWENACKDFHDSYDALAFPDGLAKELELLKTGNLHAISSAIIYLEADPYFHRSGYIKQKLVRLLKKSPLTHDQKEQLREVIIKAIHENGRREFVEYCRLARVIQNELLIKRIQDIAHSAHDEFIIARAKQLLDTLR